MEATMNCQTLAERYDLELIGSYLCYDLRRIRPPLLVLEVISEKFNVSIEYLKKIDYFDFVMRRIQIDLDAIEINLGLHVKIVNKYNIGIDCREIKVEEYNSIFYSYEVDSFVSIIDKIVSDNLTTEVWYDFYYNKLI
jgi:hypothetical protein